MKMVECCKICQGVRNQSFEVLEENVHNVCGKKFGKVEEIVCQDRIGNEQCSKSRRSLACEYFMDTPSVRSICKNCNLLRRNMSVQLVRFNNNLQERSKSLPESSKSKVNKRFLSREDISDRENDQKRRRIIAEKRAKYWKFKAVEEKNMKCMTKNDDNDLLVMFKELDKVNNEDKEMFLDDPKLSLFWEMQRDVISKKSKKIYTMASSVSTVPLMHPGLCIISNIFTYLICNL